MNLPMLARASVDDLHRNRAPPEQRHLIHCNSEYFARSDAVWILTYRNNSTIRHPTRRNQYLPVHRHTAEPTASPLPFGNIA
jgi:hypothetical protein